MDHPEVVHSTRAEIKMWEDNAVAAEREKMRVAIDNYRNNLIESYREIGLPEEHQQGLLDGLRLALIIIGK